MSVQKDDLDRRGSDRRPIEREVQYKVLKGEKTEAEARGKTLNISSSGVLFTTEQALLPGRRVEVAIDWPVKLDDKCALRLIARGRVVRNDGNRAAVEILQHEFRTRSSRP